MSKLASGGLDLATVGCTLIAEGSNENFDVTEATLPRSGRATLVATLGHTSSTTSRIYLACSTNDATATGSSVKVTFGKITAIKVGLLTASSSGA